MTYSETDVLRLGERLDSIDLDAGERAALDALVAFAARRPSELEALQCAEHADRYKLVLTEILFEPEASAN